MTTPSTVDALPLRPPLPFPPGQTEEQIAAILGSIELEHAQKAELENYWRQDWRRFVYTLGLASELRGTCLEIGANPYFTTTLLLLFTKLELHLTNYFGPQFGTNAEQTITFRDPFANQPRQEVYSFAHFNIEQEPFPFPNSSFDVVLLCEVLEHLQNDPIRVLLEIKRVLKRRGRLILTTPNVARLENLLRLTAGENIYDPYSGYGPYGRHNREYNKHDLARLLEFCGFELEILFSADVHANAQPASVSSAEILPLVAFRQEDLGQYLFSRSNNARPERRGRPSWLYRSLPAHELVS